MQSRKRSWMREEVILALDLYLREEIGTAASRRALSEALRAWPIERDLADGDQAFRGEQSVRNKLYNLQYLATGGERGREKGGAVTEAVWHEFGEDHVAVVAAAAEIVRAFEDLSTEGRAEPDSYEYEADESGIVTRTHRHRERDRRLVAAKRNQVLEETGALACEACGWDAEALHGVPSIVECHHLRAVSDLEPGERTRLADVRLVCPNCHRLIHARRPWLTWAELVGLLQH
jgi:5-methylcytosine-specific restriction protein A